MLRQSQLSHKDSEFYLIFSRNLCISTGKA